ncbi:MAG: site-specific integrase, partial [Planctomycetaceae bacterium]|nr:site-specific integrase [Planctomycetaceae bacterium]
TISLQELYETVTKNKTIRNKSDANNIKRAFGLLAECVPDANTSNFDIESLIVFQRFLSQEKKYARIYCNKLVNFVRYIFKWGGIFKLVSPFVVHSLKLIPPVAIGDAKENPPRKEVPQNDIELVLESLPKKISDMLRLMQLTAMRPSEVFQMKIGDIDMKWDNDDWLYSPPKHKTTWRGKNRAIILGSEEQDILEKYLNGDPEKNIFLNQKGNPFNTSTFDKAISKIIKKKKLPKFTPYQLRHTSLTNISAEHGRDVARAVAGHCSEIITGVYDHSDLRKFKTVVDSRKKNNTPFTRSTLKIFTGE